MHPFFCKNTIYFQTLLGGLGGSGGLVWGVWGAVGLEKLVDSLTWRLSPTTKFGSDPVSLRSGPGMAKKSQGKSDNFSRKSQEIPEI